MRTLPKITLLILGLLASGLARMPTEQRFTEELRERRLAPPSLGLETWANLGQNSLAGTFGGLRSAIAFFTSLSAHNHFENQEWYDLKKDFELISALAPYNPFYWSQGGSHLAFNAASWARSRRDQPEIQRLTIEREYLEAGDAFLKKGTTYLPENAELHAEIARIWSHTLKRPDYPRAVTSWEKAAQLAPENPIYQRRYFYTLAQCPGRAEDALNEGIRSLEQYPQNLSIPSFRSILWALYQNPELPLDTRKPTLIDLFRTKHQAYKDLYNFHYRAKEQGFYPGNIEADLRLLILELNIPEKYNPFKSPRQRRFPKDW